MIVLSGIHGTGGGGLLKEVPKGSRKARQSRRGGAFAGLGRDPEPSWGYPPCTLAPMPLAVTPKAGLLISVAEAARAEKGCELGAGVGP